MSFRRRKPRQVDDTIAGRAEVRPAFHWKNLESVFAQQNGIISSEQRASDRRRMAETQKAARFTRARSALAEAPCVLVIIYDFNNRFWFGVSIKV